MPSKSTTKKKKTVTDEPPPPEFHAAIAEYYEAKDKYDEEKVKFWAGIPQEPLNKCPKQPYEKPWWIKEQEEQVAKMYPRLDLKGKSGGVGPLTEALQELYVREKEANDLKKKETVEEIAKAGKAGQKGGKFNIDDLWIDEDLLVDALTGEEGLVVPPGLEFPK